MSQESIVHLSEEMRYGLSREQYMAIQAGVALISPLFVELYQKICESYPAPPYAIQQDPKPPSPTLLNPMAFTFDLMTRISSKQDFSQCFMQYPTKYPFASYMAVNTYMMQHPELNIILQQNASEMYLVCLFHTLKESDFYKQNFKWQFFLSDSALFELYVGLKTYFRCNTMAEKEQFFSFARKVVGAIAEGEAETYFEQYPFIQHYISNVAPRIRSFLQVDRDVLSSLCAQMEMLYRSLLENSPGSLQQEEHASVVSSVAAPSLADAAPEGPAAASAKRPVQVRHFSDLSSIPTVSSSNSIGVQQQERGRKRGRSGEREGASFASPPPLPPREGEASFLPPPPPSTPSNTYAVPHGISGPLSGARLHPDELSCLVKRNLADKTLVEARELFPCAPQGVQVETSREEAVKMLWDPLLHLYVVAETLEQNNASRQTVPSPEYAGSRVFGTFSLIVEVCAGQKSYIFLLGNLRLLNGLVEHVKCNPGLIPALQKYQQHLPSLMKQVEFVRLRARKQAQADARQREREYNRLSVHVLQGLGDTKVSEEDCLVSMGLVPEGIPPDITFTGTLEEEGEEVMEAGLAGPPYVLEPENSLGKAAAQPGFMYAAASATPFSVPNAPQGSSTFFVPVGSSSSSATPHMRQLQHPSKAKGAKTAVAAPQRHTTF